MSVKVVKERAFSIQKALWHDHCCEQYYRCIIDLYFLHLMEVCFLSLRDFSTLLMHNNFKKNIKVIYFLVLSVKRVINSFFSLAQNKEAVA